MVLRRVLGALLGNPRLAERLAETKPVRAAARLTAEVLVRVELRLVPRAARLLHHLRRRIESAARARGSPRTPGDRK